MIDLLTTAKAVKRGARLLDKKVSGWRKTLKKHASTFNISNADCCILGTLEHYNGRMRVLNARRVRTNNEGGYFRGLVRLRISTEDEAKNFGFLSDRVALPEGGSASNTTDLQTLWRAEFEA